MVVWYVPPNAQDLTLRDLYEGIGFAVTTRAATPQKVMEGVFTSTAIDSPQGRYINTLIRTDQYAQLAPAQLWLSGWDMPMTKCLNLSDRLFLTQYRVIRLSRPPH